MDRHLVMARIAVALAVSTVGGALCATREPGAGEVPNYRLEQSTLNAAGAVSESMTFRVRGSLGQEMTIGASCSEDVILQSGFWSFAGNGLVPIWLTVELVHPDPPEPPFLGLSWSGNSPPYAVYETETTNCSGIFDGPEPTPLNELSASREITPAELTCFNVVGKATQAD